MTKRKDSKGRVLRDGESQRKDGRYVYQYYNRLGERKSVYSWTLNPSDKVPPGKKCRKSLRELEDDIAKMKNSGISPDSKVTIRDIVTELCDIRVKGKSTSTKRTYSGMLTHLESDPMFSERVTSVTPRRAEIWILSMLADGIGYYVVLNIKQLLKSAFDRAIRFEIISKNPFDFRMPDNDTEKRIRVALTEEQATSLLDYVKSSRWQNWYCPILILLETGLRISEFIGLTLNDIDFEQKLIHVRRQLLYDGSGGRYKIESQNEISGTKTPDGIRSIPMSTKAESALREMIAARKIPKEEFSVDGVSGFLFLGRSGKPKFRVSVDKSFRKIINSYNQTHENHLPQITPHDLRHTYCTNLVKKGMSIKGAQYLMGHKDVRMTMGVYTHVHAQSAIDEFRRLTAS